MTFPGALDPSFDTDGMPRLSVSAGIDSIHQMRLLADEKVLAMGVVNHHYGIMRFHTELTLDVSFGTRGTETNLGHGRHADAMEIDAEGRILLWVMVASFVSGPMV